MRPHLNLYVRSRKLSIDDAELKLRIHFIKATTARKVILILITSKYEPICAEQLYNELTERAQKNTQKNNGDAKINLSTIYRTLSVFEENGLIREAQPVKEVGDRRRRYYKFK